MIVDWMHNMAGLEKWSKKTFIGPYGDQKGSARQYRKKQDAQTRRHLKENGVFPSLWADAPQYLDQRKTDLLRNMNPEQIAHQNATWCKKWWKACGKQVPKGTRVTTLRSQIHQWHDYLVANPGKSIVVSIGILTLTLTLTLIYPPQPPSFLYTLSTRLQTVTVAVATASGRRSRQTSPQHRLPSWYKWLLEGWN